MLGAQVVSVACITLHLLEFVIRPPARYPDLFPVLNVLISTPVFGLVWLWSIRSGIEVGWAIVGLGGGNPAGAHSNQTSQPASSSSTANLGIATSPKKSRSHLTYLDELKSPLSPTDSQISPLSPFIRRVGSPPTILGPHRPGVREKTWSSASSSSNARTRGSLPVGPGWERSLSLDMGVQGENHSRQSRGQSLDISNVRKRVLNFPRNTEDLPPPSE